MKTPLNRSADGARMQPGAPLSSLKSPAMTGNIVNKEPPMQDTQCLAIRDWLFDQHDRVTGTARLFRYVAVVPNDSDVKSATVHYALARPVPITGTFAAEPDDIVRELLAQSPFRSAELHLAEHDVLKDSWPVKWGLTAKDSLSNWPVLVLSERDDKSVYGVVMRSPNLESNALRFASLYCDPEEVGLILDLLMLMQPDDAFLGWFKESEIAASDLEQALAATPQTDAGQKFVLLYRTDEWLSGIWNADRPIVERINLTSLADFHGIPVSLAKKRRRADLEQACDNQTVTGDYDALVKALTAAGGEMPSRGMRLVERRGTRRHAPRRRASHLRLVRRAARFPPRRSRGAGPAGRCAGDSTHLCTVSGARQTHRGSRLFAWARAQRGAAQRVDPDPVCQRQSLLRNCASDIRGQ